MPRNGSPIHLEKFMIYIWFPSSVHLFFLVAPMNSGCWESIFYQKNHAELTTPKKENRKLRNPTGFHGKWYIYLHEWWIFCGFHVGKYTSLMDPMGMEMELKYFTMRLGDWTPFAHYLRIWRLMPTVGMRIWESSNNSKLHPIYGTQRWYITGVCDQ